MEQSIDFPVQYPGPLLWKPCDDGLPTWDCIDSTTRQPENIIHALFNTYYTLHSYTIALSYTLSLDLRLHGYIYNKVTGRKYLNA